MEKENSGEKQGGTTGTGGIKINGGIFNNANC